jgi:hypothetical protein
MRHWQLGGYERLHWAAIESNEAVNAGDQTQMCRLLRPQMRGMREARGMGVCSVHQLSSSWRGFL